MRGQTSIELLIILSTVVVVMAVMGLFIYQKYVRGDELKILIHGRRIVNTVANNVDAINTVGDGYSQKMTLPPYLYGNRDYSISFFQNESTVYLQGGSFLRGIRLAWSAPLSTIKVWCLMSECNNICNRTPYETCLKVNDTMNIRVTNSEGIVYLTYPYNLRHQGKTYQITPVRGNLTYDDGSCRDGSYIYVYKNTLDGTTNLVFQHNSSEDNEVKMDFYETMSELNVTLSDDEGELNLLTSPEGDWKIRREECSGGVINIKEGVHLCINTNIEKRGALSWYWLNGDGTTITLDDRQELCLSYP
jgi:hypothetical protein